MVHGTLQHYGVEACSGGLAELMVDKVPAAELVTSLEQTVAELRERLSESEIRHRYACELGGHIPWLAAPNGDIIEFAPLWTTLTGLTHEETVGSGWAAAFNPDDLSSVLAIWQHALATGESFETDYRLIMRSGELRWFRVRAAARRWIDGTIMCWYGSIEDIHDRKSVKDALRASEALTRSVLESTTDNVVVLDRDWRITFMNARGAEYIRKSCNGAIGDLFWDLYPDQRGSIYDLRYREAVSSGVPVRFEAYVPRLDIWLDLNACPTSAGLAVFFRDITESKRAADALLRLAHQDTLTGLGNRTVFNEAMEVAFAHRTERETSILLLDLDLFKEVNDTLGHSVGDELLRSIAKRLQAIVGQGDILVRLGGDEFAVVHQSVHSAHSASVLARELLASLSEPFIVGGIAIKLAASIGIATSSPTHESDNELFKAADIALYRAKEAGRGTICTFDTLMSERVRVRNSLKHDLGAALALGELRVVYQPIMNLGTGLIAGAEALLRWRHPVRGEVPPLDFIALAEETGLIIPIGDWVLNEACREAASWPDPCSIAVNLSPVQIRDETLPLRVASALSKAGLMPGRLELEITESVLLQNSDRSLAVLNALRELGVRIALDDFGTGYSSLSYLRHFLFDKLKLDRCFVNDLGNSPQSQAIARAAGEMGRAFSMTTTAEGVETQEQLDWLRANGWEQAQGYHIGRPTEVSGIRGILARRQTQVGAASG